MFPFSPFVYMCLHLSLHNDCNEVTNAYVQNLKAMDMFKCELDLHIPSHNHNATITVPCNEFRQQSMYATNVVSIMMNKWHKEKSCLQIIKGYEDKYMSRYDDVIGWYYISMIECALFFLLICIINIGAYLEEKNKNKKLQIEKKES